MEFCVTSALIGISLYMVIQGLRFIFADADFTLLWASMMGSKPGKPYSLDLRYIELSMSGSCK